MATNVPSSYDVYISYNHDYDHQVKTLHYELSISHNIPCWFEDLMSNRLLFEDLSKGIRSSKVFICCLSKKYAESKYCIDELIYAYNLRKKILVLMLDNLSENDLGTIGLVIKKLNNKLLVYEYENGLLEASVSDLYNLIIGETLKLISEHNDSEPEQDDSISMLDFNMEEEEQERQKSNVNTNVDNLKSVRTLLSHSDAVYSVKCLPNNRLASGSEDFTIKIWDLLNYELIITFRGHTSNVTMLRAVEGNKLVSGGGDGLIIVWSLDTYEQIKIIKAHSMPISALKELPEKNVVTSALDCTIKIWCLHTFTCLKVIEKFKNRSSLKKLFSKNSSSEKNNGHSKPIFCFKVANDTKLISASSDSLIKVWDLNDFNLLANLEGHSDIICTIKKMSDNRLVSGSYDRKIKIWCLLKYVCIQTLTGHSDEVQCLLVLPNNRLLSGGCDYSIKLWDLNSNNECIHTFLGHTKNINMLKELKNDRFISFSNGDTRLWDLKNMKLLEVYNEHTKIVSCVTLLMNNRIASSSWDHTVKVWNFS